MSSSWSSAITKAQGDQVKNTDPVVYHPYKCQNVQVGIKGELAELKQDGKHCYVALPDQTPFALVFYNTGAVAICVKSKIGNKTNGKFVVLPYDTCVIERPHDVDRPFVFFEDGNSEEAKAAFVDNDEPDKDLVEFQLFLSKRPFHVDVWEPIFKFSLDCPDTERRERGDRSSQEKGDAFGQPSNGAVGLGATATNQRFTSVDFECQDRPAFTWYIRLIPRDRATPIPPKWITQRLNPMTMDV